MWLIEKFLFLIEGFHVALFSWRFPIVLRSSMWTDSREIYDSFNNE